MDLRSEIGHPLQGEGQTLVYPLICRKVFTSQLAFSFILTKALKALAYGQNLSEHLLKAVSFLGVSCLHFHFITLQSLKERPWPVN